MQSWTGFAGLKRYLPHHSGHSITEMLGYKASGQICGCTFSPAPVMKLVEVIRVKIPAMTLHICDGVCKRVGKAPIAVLESTLFVNRILLP